MKIIKSIDKYGTIRYKNEYKEFHREDGPALERPNGYKVWFKKGSVHREDGPARIFSDGTIEYWLDNKYCDEKDWEEKVTKIKLKRITEL